MQLSNEQAVRIQPPVIPPEMDTHDNTMMSAYNYCERFYAIRHVLNQTKIGKSPALQFGGLIHYGLQHYYNVLPARAEERTMEHVFAGAEAAVTAMQSYEDFEDPIDDYRTRERAIDTMVKYIKHYERDLDLEVLHFTETPFDVMFEDSLKWGGIVDLHTQYHGADWVIDHKTTSVFGQHYYDDLARSPQFMGYVMAFARLSGRWPSGLLANVLVVRKASTEFSRRPLIFPDWLMAESREMFIINYQRIHEQLKLTTSVQDVFNPYIWRPNLYNCVGKYGRCSAWDVCHARPENRERVLEMDYEENRWDWRTERE